MTHILSVDPGKKSGWVEWADGKILAHGEMEQQAICEYAFGQRHILDIIVCESYLVTIQTAKKSQQPMSLEIIGALRFVAGLELDLGFLLQTPAAAKKFSSDARLKAEGFWLPTRDGHTNDASRHLLLFLCKRGYHTPEALSA